MLKHKKLSMAVAGALALAGASTANAGIGFKAGEWDVDFSGNVNGFATYNDCATHNVPTIAGGLACNQPAGSKQSTTSIESGLLPSALVFSAKSRQANMDVGVTIGVYPTLRTFGLGDSNNGSLGSSSLNIRQNFLTFGDASWGNVKIGRDLGLFGSDAILSDMTLVGRRFRRGVPRWQHDSGPHRRGLHLRGLDPADHLHLAQFRRHPVCRGHVPDLQHLWVDHWCGLEWRKPERFAHAGMAGEAEL